MPVLVAVALLALDASAQQDGSIRGLVLDADFDRPLGGATVSIVETGARQETNPQGNFAFHQIPPGSYTLTFRKVGYIQQVRGEVAVNPGVVTDVDVALTGDFTDMEEFVVQDVLAMGSGSEEALLELRFDSPGMVDSVGSELMSRAGASDAASALRLVSGATITDGRFAVIRGLPDRYVASKVNGVRMVSADEDKRSLELDQFPSPVIDSLQVSKTFTPDQQGDASGGAVDVRLKGIPDDPFVQFKYQYSYNTNVGSSGSDFLSYDGGGPSYWGDDTPTAGSPGVSLDDAPTDTKWSFATGGTFYEEDDVRIGGLFSLFHEHDSSFFDDGENNSLWVTTPGGPMVPKTLQGTPGDGDFKTALFDVTQGVDSIQLGGLASLGLETEDHTLNLSYIYSRTAEDTTTLAEDTRGKTYFFPGYDKNDPLDPGNQQAQAAPWIRTETIDYERRQVGSTQLSATHSLDLLQGFELGDLLTFSGAEIDWGYSHNTASLDQPDKTQFGSLWLAPSYNPGFPPFVPPFTTPPVFLPFKPAANFNLGNLQEIEKFIEETGDQYQFNVEFPFVNWDGNDGYVKVGYFHDDVDRTYDENTRSNFGDSAAQFQGDWNEFWSQAWIPSEHPLSDSDFDVDYKGDAEIEASYAMIDMPLTGNLNLIAGARWESTQIGIVNDPEDNAVWFPPGFEAPTAIGQGDADVDFSQHDLLPSIGLVYEPFEKVVLRASYSETVARQTFKELSPIIQQEFLGGPIFIGNPDLEMAALDNYDLRMDYTPYDGALISASWFKKDIADPIEYVQKVATGFTYTTPVNYQEGRITGYELEIRQDLGHFWEDLEGLSIGANGTFLDSRVRLTEDEIAGLKEPNIQAPMETRDMTDAPEYLYNLYLTYDIEETGTQAALFYTVTGDTLIAGAGESNGNYVPNIYAKDFGTLNFTLSQQLSDRSTFQFQAKNLTNPRIEEYYDSDFIAGKPTKTTFTRGREFSVSINVTF